METQIQPYLFYEGRCEEAVAFYRDALGAELLMLMRYRDSPEGPAHGVPPGGEDKVMHAALQVGGATLLLSDGLCSGQARFEGFAVALWVADAATAGRMFAALAAGGQVRLPLGPTFFAPAFGMVADRFGVPWMVTARGEAAPC